MFQDFSPTTVPCISRGLIDMVSTFTGVYIYDRNPCSVRMWGPSFGNRVKNGPEV